MDENTIMSAVSFRDDRAYVVIKLEYGRTLDEDHRIDGPEVSGRHHEPVSTNEKLIRRRAGVTVDLEDHIALMNLFIGNTGNTVYRTSIGECPEVDFHPSEVKPFASDE